MKSLKLPRPLMRYHGAKWLLAPWIISHFPAHRIYTEVYGGSAAVLLQKPPCYAEVYNDLDGEIVNVFNVMRERGDEMRRALILTPFAREEFLAAHEPSADPFERCRRTIVRSYMGHGSNSIQRKSGFRANSNRSGTTPAHDWAHFPAALPPIIERLRGVVVEQRPALDVLLTHDGDDTLHYVDPPYVTETRDKGHDYRHEMKDADHVQMANVLRGLRGMVVLSGYRCGLYDALFEMWHRIDRPSLADGARPRTESLWLNPAVMALRTGIQQTIA